MACLGTEAVHIADAFVSITYLRSDDCTFCHVTFDFCTTTIEVESEEVHVVHLLTVRI